MADFRNVADEIKNRANIVDYIGRVVSLQKKGGNYWGCCPFHTEKTPSFSVSESKQYFTCFGCGAKGDLVTFVERYYNLGFVEALEKLGQEYGVEVKSSGNANTEKYKRLYEINREAAVFFMKALYKPGCPGYKYITSRGLSPETLKEFGIGYADDDWHSLRNHLRSKGYDDKTMLALGLLSESKGKVYDKFRGRVIFPIINTSGKVIGFGGRIIGDGEPKYLNSSESPIFQKKNNLYALNLSRKYAGEQDCAILVEGYMDVVSLYQNGVKNVAASLGTALTENQAKLLKRYTKNIVLSYDADNAGRKAALRGIEILHKEECNVKVLHVSDGKDPDEFVKKNGPEAFRKEVKSALNYAEYRLEDVKRRFPPSDDEQRINFMKEAASVIRSLSPVEQDIYIKKVATDQGLSEGALRREVEMAPTEKVYERKPVERESGPVEKPDIPISDIEKLLIKVLTVEPSVYKQIAIRKHIFVSASGANIFSGIKEQLSGSAGGDFLDVKALADGLSNEDAEILKDIIENVPVEGKVEETLQQCFTTIERKDLERRRDELTTMLDLIDENNNSIVEKAKEMLEEVMFLNSEIEKLKNKY